MAIQMRRGAYAEFDPLKMKAGEWAVSTDSDTKKQQIWMCFAPGIVKRMGTVEDFDVEIQRLIQSYLDGMAQSVSQAQKSAQTATEKANSASSSASQAQKSAELATSKAQESATSANNAKASETKAKASETNARTSEDSASISARNAKTSETNSKASETNAKKSEANASTSAANAKASETNAKKSEANASTSAANAKASETNAKKSEANASTSAANAKASETNAKASASNARTSETNSAKSESEAQKYAEQVKEISESFSGALRPLGTINFADLPSTADANSGDMYNITDQFTTTTDFKEGAGNIIPAGSNVYLTVDRYWDVLAGTPVTGVKGAKEAYYRRGNVNITPANIGAVAEGGNISDTTVTFAATTTRANLVSGEKVSVGFGKIKKWFADLKSFAFKDLVNNLTTSTTGSALDASQGKILNDKYDELNRSLSFKVNTTDSRLSDARTPKPHTHDDRYYTESEINTKLNALVKNHIVVSLKAELITVTGNSDREYSFSFSLPSDAGIITQLPIIYAGGKGISIGRNVNKDFTVLLWNNNSSTQNVGVIYYVVYII
jgi:chemotaxis protein histidine kinase CheA